MRSRGNPIGGKYGGGFFYCEWWKYAKKSPLFDEIRSQFDEAYRTLELVLE